MTYNWLEVSEEKALEAGVPFHSMFIALSEVSLSKSGSKHGEIHACLVLSMAAVSPCSDSV